MGDLINLRRMKKAAERTTREKAAAVNRIVHGTPRHQRKAAKAEKLRADGETEAHKLDTNK